MKLHLFLGPLSPPFQAWSLAFYIIATLWLTKLNQGNFDSFMTLSHDSLEEIHWWSENILIASRRIFHNIPDVVVYTDASQIGWGAQIEHGNNGIWSKSESSRHINYLEL